MSIKAMTYIWDHSKQKGSKLLMLLAIADRCDDFGVCYPGHKNLASKSRISTNSVSKNIKALEETGELSVIMHDGIETTHGKTNRYYLKKYRDNLGIETPAGNRAEYTRHDGKLGNEKHGALKPTPQDTLESTPHGALKPTPYPSEYPSVDSSEKTLSPQKHGDAGGHEIELGSDGRLTEESWRYIDGDKPTDAVIGNCGDSFDSGQRCIAYDDKSPGCLNCVYYEHMTCAVCQDDRVHPIANIYLVGNAYPVNVCSSCHGWLQSGCPGYPPMDIMADGWLKQTFVYGEQLVCTNPGCGGIIKPQSTIYRKGKQVLCPGCWLTDKPTTIDWQPAHKCTEQSCDDGSAMQKNDNAQLFDNLEPLTAEMAAVLEYLDKHSSATFTAIEKHTDVINLDAILSTFSVSWYVITGWHSATITDTGRAALEAYRDDPYGEYEPGKLTDGVEATPDCSVTERCEDDGSQQTDVATQQSPTPPKPKAKKPRKRSAKQLANDAIVDAIVDAFGHNPDTLTNVSWSLARKVAKELLTIPVPATPEQISKVHAYCNVKFDNFGYGAIASNYAAWSATVNPVGKAKEVDDEFPRIDAPLFAEPTPDDPAIVAEAESLSKEEVAALEIKVRKQITGQ